MSCVTFNILTTVIYYDELLPKVKIDHYVRNKGLKTKYEKKKKKNLSASTPWARHEHTAATACAP